MCNIIYDTLKLIDLSDTEKVKDTLSSLEYLFTGIIPNVYFCRQQGEFITWIIKSYDHDEFCRVIIGKNTFEII